MYALTKNPFEFLKASSGIPVSLDIQVHRLESVGLVGIPAGQGSLLTQVTADRRVRLGVTQVTQDIPAGRGFQVDRASQAQGFLVTVVSRVISVSPVSLGTAD